MIEVNENNIDENNKQTKIVDKFVRSPLFYVGDKYKLMPQLVKLFPDNINTFYDVFCGGGSVSLNVKANHFILNDSYSKIVELHKFLILKANDIDSYINETYIDIKKYGLSLSEKENNESIEKLKKEHKKTYFAKFNKESYLRLRNDYNHDTSNTKLLYLLLIYGFNHMIRFNNSNKFNLPVGNVDWNKNVTNALRNYSKWVNENDIKISEGLDFEIFTKGLKFKKGDFIYFDPPYLISCSDYNKFWGIDDELRLYNLLDELDKRGIKWGLSNMVYHKGQANDILIEWSKKYTCYDIKSNYISRFDNTVKNNSKEIYVTNIL